MTPKNWIAVLALLLLGHSLQAQIPLVSKHYDAQSGMVDAVVGVQGIVQDDAGYIWVASQNGVLRFDGRHFRHFPASPQDSILLTHPNGQFLEWDRDGLWVGGVYGLNRFDPIKEQWQRYEPHSPGTYAGVFWGNAPLPDGRRLVSAGASQQAYLEPESGVMRLLKVDSAALANRVTVNDSVFMLVHDWTPDPDNPWILWGGGTHGLLRYNHRDSSMESIPLRMEGGLEPLERASIWRVLAPSNSPYLWMGTWAHGLLRYNKETRTFKRYLCEPDGVLDSRLNIVLDIAKDGSGRLWLAAQNGLFVFDPADSSMLRINVYPNVPADNHPPITAVYAARDGRIWAGSKMGLALLDPDPAWDMLIDLKSPMPSAPGVPLSVCGLQRNAEGYLICSNEGLFGCDVSGQVLWSENQSIRPIRPGKGDDWRGMVRDARGTTWLYNQALYRYDSLSRTAHRPAWPGWDKVQNSISISDAAAGKDGSLWLASRQGVVRVDPSTGKFQTWLTTDTGTGMLESYVWDLVVDDRQRAWYCTSRALMVIDPDRTRVDVLMTGRRQQSAPLLIEATSAWPDEDGHVWVGTKGNGMYRFDRDAPLSSQEPEHWGPDRGLFHGYVNHIQGDRQGRLLIGHPAGFTLLNPRTDIAQSISQQRDLPALTYISAYWFLVDGQVWRPFRNGVLSIPLPTFRISVDSMRVLLDAFHVFDQRRRFDRPIQTVNDIQLRYNENFFSLDLTLLDFHQPENIRFSWQLEGIDPAWVAPTNLSKASYTNLRPGNYRFLFKAVHANGEETAIESIQISIRPPWWMSVWFYVACVVLLGSIVGFLVYLRWQRFRAVQAVRDSIARDLHDDMGSTLSSINLQSAMAQRVAEGTRKDALLESISGSAQSMLETMDDIVWSVNPQHDGMDQMLARMRKYAAEVLEAKDIAFEFEADSALAKKRLRMDMRRDLYLVFKEAVNNLAKYAQASEAVISWRAKGKSVHISVKDNGIGFDPTAPNKRNGLQNMRRRVEAHGGIFTLRSAPGEGTLVGWSMPLR